MICLVCSRHGVCSTQRSHGSLFYTNDAKNVAVNRDEIRSFLIHVVEAKVCSVHSGEVEVSTGHIYEVRVYTVQCDDACISIMYILSMA